MARRKKTKPHIGSSFEDFLCEDGTYEETTARAINAFTPPVMPAQAGIHTFLF